MTTNNSINIPTGALNTILQGQGVGITNAFSTATYPATTTSQQILYSTANNVVGQLTTANSKFPATNSSGTLAMRSLSVVSQVFTSSGTYTPTSGMVYCIAEAVGAGGGGAGCPSTTGTQVAAGAGGGGGGYVRGTFSAATIGASQTVTIGAGGAGGVGNSSGSNGGNTTFGALLSGNGGIGGANASASTLTLANGGQGGNSSGGTFAFDGSNGGVSFGAVVNGVPAVYGGSGGASFFAGTRDGANTTSGATQTNGNVGLSFGGGGSGAISSTFGSSADGGAGADGVVVVTEFVIS